MQQHPPSYLKLAASGALSDRVHSALKQLDSCDLCPHLCHTARNAGKTGFCRAGSGI